MLARFSIVDRVAKRRGPPAPSVAFRCASLPHMADTTTSSMRQANTVGIDDGAKLEHAAAK